MMTEQTAHTAVIPEPPQENGQHVPAATIRRPVTPPPNPEITQTRRVQRVPESLTGRIIDSKA